MSSRNPSPATLSRNLLGTIDDSEQVTLAYNLAQLNTWPNNIFSEPQYSAPRRINCSRNNTIAENDNNNVSTTPFAYHEVIICELNVKKYKPKDLWAMKAGNDLIIMGNHDEKLDEHGLPSRKFTKRIAIPKDIIADEIKIHLSSDGKLIVTGKKRSEIRKISLHQTNGPDFQQSANPLCLPHVSCLPSQQQSIHFPFQPNYIYLPFQQRLNRLLFQQHNNRLPFQPNYIYLPFQQHLNHVSFQPHNNDLPFQPHNNDLPFQPHNNNLPFQPHNNDLPFQPHNNDLPFQPYNNDLPIQPNFIYLPFQQHVNHLPFQPNFIYLPFQQYNNQLPYQPNFLYLPFQQQVNYLPFQHHVNHLPS